MHLPTLLLLLATTAATAQSWQLQPTPASPPARGSHTLVTDPANGRTILFGGYVAPSYRNDCWAFDGTTWTTLPTGPAIRGRHAMAFDEARGAAVLFGGINSTAVTGYLFDTWEFQNGAWSQRSTGIVRPSARFGHGMAYDRVRQRVVLFGGRTNAGTIFLNDTWEWNGTAWAAPATATAPSRRMDHAMAQDPVSGQVLLFGGMPLGGPVIGDTWTWNGLSWLPLAPAHAPSPRMQAAVATDPRRGRIVLFAGYDGSDLTDTWEWDGSDWRQVPTVAQPGAVVLPAMAAGPGGGHVVLFGGQTSTGTYLAETWWFDQWASVTAYGTGCGSPPLALAAASSPAIGQVFSSTLSPLPPGSQAFASLGLSNTVLNGLPLPLDLTPFQAPGCYVLHDLAAPFLMMWGTGSTANHSFQIPASPAFAGVQIYQQGVVFGAGFNPAGIATSNGLSLTLGF